MASIQKVVNAYKEIHHDQQQLVLVKKVLIDCTEKLNNSQKSRKEIAKLTMLTSEVLDVVVDDTQNGLKAMAPSHSFARTIEQKEADQRRESAAEIGFIVTESVDAEKHLRVFLKRKKSNSRSPVVSPSPKKARRSERRKPTQNDEYSPNNSKIFSPIELHNILLPLDATERGALVKTFSEKNWLHYKGLAPGRCVRRFMTKSVANPCSIMSYWDKGGRPPVCDRKRFEQKYKEYLVQNLGMMVGLDKVKGWLKEMKEELIINDGGVPTEEDSKVSESTARNYHASIVYSDTDDLVPHYVQMSSSSATVPRKPDNRHTMERSLISAMSYALVVSATHAVPADDENFPKEEDCTPGAWEWVTKVRDASPLIKMRMLEPHEIINHDNCTDVVFEGIHMTRTNEILVAHVNSLSNRGTHGLYIETTEHDEKTSLFRIKRTLAISASGHRSQPFYTIAGLSEFELPRDKCPEGFLVMAIHGLSPSAATDPFDEKVGYVCLMRSQKGAEQVKFSYWRKNVLYPFVRRLQEVHRDWDSCTPLPRLAQNVLWLDGAPEQIKATLKMQKADAEINLTTCKHNAARTAVEQACDTGKCFKDGKAALKKLTTKNKTTPLKTRLYASFDTAKHQCGLNLSGPKKAAYIYCLSVAPQVEAHAGQTDKIHHGWIKNGMIDSVSMSIHEDTRPKDHDSRDASPASD